MEEINNKLIGIAGAKLAIKELIENGIPVTPMIIGHEMIAIFDEYSDRDIWKKSRSNYIKKHYHNKLTIMLVYVIIF